MRTEVVMPQMGESVAEGTLTTWLKEIGERVERDEPLFEITTDKVDAEVPSPVAGTVVEWLVEPGTTVEINTLVAIIEAEGAPAAAKPQPEEAAPTKAQAADNEASRPDHQSQQPRAAESSPAPQSAARSGGAIDSVRPGPDTDRETLQRTRSTPLVRKIAATHGIQDLSSIAGTGRSGRVTKHDIMGFIEQGGARDEQAPATTARAQQPKERRTGALGQLSDARDPLAAADHRG